MNIKNIFCIFFASVLLLSTPALSYTYPDPQAALRAEIARFDKAIVVLSGLLVFVALPALGWAFADKFERERRWYEVRREYKPDAPRNY